MNTNKIYTGPNRNVTTQILKREIVRHGLKYNTIGNAIIDDNPYLKAAKS